MTNKITIWARTLAGLEWIAAAEAESSINATQIKLSHREITFNCESIELAQRLRTIDDAYIYCGCIKNLDHTRSSLCLIKEQIKTLPLPFIKLAQTVKTIRVTASFLGKRNYNRYEIEDAIGNDLSKRLGLEYVNSKSQISTNILWCRVHLTEDNAKIGIKLSDTPIYRRTWRQSTLIGALHPPLAAAMAILADLKVGKTILDPFVGNGTILIEAGLMQDGLNLIGYDISELCIKASKIHAKLANVLIDFKINDSSMANFDKTDCVITNPPWGKDVKIVGNLKLENLASILFKDMKTEGSRLVIIIDKDINFQKLIENFDVDIFICQTVRVNGLLAELLVIGKDLKFSNDNLGKSLKKYWCSSFHK